MKSQDFKLVRYDADEGKVFDWAEPHYVYVPVDETRPDGEMKQIQEHLYATTLFIGSNDSIDNYVEVVETIAEAEICFN